MLFVPKSSDFDKQVFSCEKRINITCKNLDIFWSVNVFVNPSALQSAAVLLQRKAAL